ncbi:hypothetical protein KGMB02408_16730 [Bacteroides faecalis]|uniref:Uncharacterized protein n=1 Tax=Bacteroides faecalis TaxID=2447885 RepID=A0A401LT33_9BACE|nr:hypothetical protein KGMB02408_16730 [Bacteroides faecalis]
MTSLIHERKEKTISNPKIALKILPACDDASIHITFNVELATDKRKYEKQAYEIRLSQ